MDNWKYQQLVPKKYHKASGISQYEWFVHDPWHLPFRFVEEDSRARRIPPSAYCSLQSTEGVLHLLVPIHRYPALGESILLLGKCLLTGTRVERFMTAYKAYECVTSSPDPEVSAVRHGLSHASTALSRQTTVRTLKRLFGTTEIDLKRYDHQRQFYVQFGALLRLVDQAVAERLRSVLSNLLHIESTERAFHDWEIAAF